MRCLRLSGPASATGFTLLEVLVGISVFSLVVLALFAGLRISARSTDAGEARSVATSAMRIADGFVRRYISQVYPAWERDNDRPGAPRRLNFEGTPEELRFTTSMPAHLGVGGLHEVTLAVSGGAEERQLTVRLKPVHPELDREQLAEEERVLIDGVLLAQFAYFGSRGRTDAAQWRDAWEEMPRLPSLVRLRVTTRDAQRWPDLVIPLHADAVRFGQTRRRLVSDDRVGER